MNRIGFILFIFVVSQVHSQNVYDGIENIIEQVLRSPNNIDGPALNLHPDTGLNISQFLEKYDYPLEYHDVTTEDGFILTMHRIPHGKNKQVEGLMENKTKPVMFLVHCLACSSMDYLWQGPNVSLGFLLADLGYDVWLANGRGNIHSMRHKTLTPNTSAFWDYTFHEKGFYDMPACIDYILDYTKLDNITYIGHSQGTTEGVVLTSTKPEYNEKINLMVFLSPITYIENLKSPVVLLLVKYINVLEVFFKSINVYGIAHGPILPFVAREFCNEDSKLQEVCIAIMDSIIGYDFPQVDKSKLTVFLTNTPNGLSLKELYHYGQEIKSGFFRQYDYGSIANILHYGTSTPPSYDINKVTVPVAAYYSKNDYLAQISDVERFLSELPNKPVEQYLIEYDQFNHLDYVTAKDVKTLLYDRLLEVLQKYSPLV